MKILLSIIGAALWLLGVIILIETAQPQEFDSSGARVHEQHHSVRHGTGEGSSAFFDLNLVAIPGFRAVDDAQLLEIYDRASWYFKQVGIVFRMRYLRRSANPCEYYHNWTVRGLELDCFKQDASTQGYRRKKLITYYMLPPWIIVNQPYGPQTALIGGIAEKLCGKIAMGNATPNQLKDGIEGESRIDHSATILAHEVGHMLCAEHLDYTPNLMHSNANAYTSEYRGRLPVLSATKRQVKRNYAKWRKL